MAGFKAGFVWYWGEPFSNVLGESRQRQVIVRHHLILGGLPAEMFDDITSFFSPDIVTYKTPAYPDEPINLVIMLRCDCKKHVSAICQFNAHVGRGRDELRD